MTDFGACKSCGRIYSLTRLKACPRCGDIETLTVEEVQIPTIRRQDPSFVKPEIETESTNAYEPNKPIPVTIPCKNCGRGFRADKLKNCPKCGYPDQVLDNLENPSSKISTKNTKNSCASCGKKLPKTYDYCPGCGSKANSPTVEIKEWVAPPSKVEPDFSKSQAETMPLHLLRQTKSGNVNSLVFKVIGILALLILAILLFSAIGSTNSTPSGGNDDTVEPKVRWETRCDPQWLPNPNYDPSDIMSNKEFLDKRCASFPIYSN